MKKSGLILSIALSLCLACKPDEAGMLAKMADLDSRLNNIEQSLASINTQIEALGTITQGNVITSLTQDSDGNYVITYKAVDNKEYSVVVSAKEQMINVPQLAVSKDPVEGIYYWVLVDPDGTETNLLDKAGNRVPVSGSAPKVSTDANGYWTVSGVQILDGAGRPITAHDGNSCIFRSIRVNEDGDMEVVLGGGKVIVLPMQQVLNLTLSEPINGTTPTSFPASLEITYSVTGSAAPNAIVALSGVSGLTAALDKDNSKIHLNFPAGFTAGYVVVIANEGTHTVIRPVFFGEGSAPEPTPVDAVEIGTAAQLAAFAQAVNNQDGSETKTAILTADINLSSVASSWKPIGKPTSVSATWDGTDNTGSFTYSGPAFKGTFNGQGHTISGFNTTSASSGVWGIFGVLDGATVKNLKVSGTMTVTASDQLAASAIAGAMLNSTIESCESNVNVTMSNSASGKRMIYGGIAGIVYSKGTDHSTIRSCVNNGELVSSLKTDNISTGFECVAFGGIAAMATAPKADNVLNVISNCTNNGAMTAKTILARCSGIIANCTYTELNACVNNGNQRNTGSGGRVGNVASYVCASRVIDCRNTGSLTTTQTDTQCGGLLGLVGGVGSTISGGGNSGAITSACTTVTEGLYHRGLLFGNLAAIESVDGLSAGGSLWDYNGGTPSRIAVNSGNVMQYIGRYASANASKITNITCDVEPVKAGISTAADLVEFASLVNSGASYAKFVDNGAVNLLMDIDLSSVSSSWTPIGNAAVSTSDDIVIEVSGHPFTGVFNGQGHSITGFKPTKTLGSAATFGLFGVLSGATVSNFTLSGTMTVSATAKSHAGCVAGVCYNSTISNVTSSVAISSSGTTKSDQRFSIGGIAGLLVGDGTVNSVINNCTQSGNASIDCGSNTNNGYTGVIYGGIVSVSTSAAVANMHSQITNCTNNGNMTVKIGRCAGIVGSCKQYTKINACTNNGKQTNSSAKNRLGQITCELGSNSRIDNCVNNGDLIATGTAAADDDIRIGGMVGAMGYGTIQGGESNARVITNGHKKNAGIVFGYIANGTAVTGVAVKGLIGTYNGGNYQMETVTASNFDVWADVTVNGSARKYCFLGAANTSKYGIVSGCIFVP